MLEAILAPLIHFVTETIGGYGVPAVFVLMLLESMGILIPSEAISPFADHLDIAGKWFDEYGELTVFVSRCLPVVRTFISFPAGTAKMNFAKFSVHTFLGCVPWVFALTYFGDALGEN